jgi:hypothetical protein
MARRSLPVNRWLDFPAVGKIVDIEWLPVY